MCRDHPRRPANRDGDELGLAGCGRGDDLPREAGPEHERLKLQPAVQQPEHAEHDLQATPRDVRTYWDESV
jgi:hypothetical protein